MPIQTACPNCGKTYQVPDASVGKKTRCKNCQGVFVVAETAGFEVVEEEVVEAPRRRTKRHRAKAGAAPKRWVMIAALAGMVILLGGGGYWLWKTKFSSGLSSVIANLDRSHPGWRLDELEAKRKEVPAEQNSALNVLAAAQQFNSRSFSLSAQETLSTQPRARQFSAEQLEELRAPLNNVQSAVTEARKIADKRYGRYAITYAKDGLSTDLKHAQHARGVVVLLQFDAAVLAQDGEIDRALASCQAGFNVARSFWDEPHSVSLLVRSACNAIALHTLERTLAQGEPSEPALAALQRILEEEADAPYLAILGRAERAVWHAMLSTMASGETKLSELQKFDEDKSMDEAKIKKQLPEAHAWMLRHTTKLIDIGALPAHQQEAAIEQWQKDYGDGPELNKKIQIALRLHVGFLRARAVLLSAATALAAERYRRAKGRWPETLAELVPGQLAEVPVDPFTGQPLRLIRHSEGVTIYSVGNDKKDNGGVINDRNQAPTNHDLGIRLWDTPKRRQKAG